ARQDGPETPGDLRPGARSQTVGLVRLAGGGGQMKTQPKVDLDSTAVNLRRVALDHAADRLGEFTADAVKHDISAHAFLDKVLGAELAFREERRIRTSLRLSGLPTGQTLASFDFAFQPSIESSRI